MCCRSYTRPLPRDWREIMEIAGFTNDPNSTRWKREMHPGLFITAEYNETQNQLDFSLYPSIGGHNEYEHQTNAPAAAILWKTMMTLAERSNGVIIQSGLVGLCQQVNGSGSKQIAHYPDQPLIWDNICLLFQEALIKGIGQGEDHGSVRSDS